jgi:hypothetical protein
MHEFFVALIEYFETVFKMSSEVNPEHDGAAYFHRLFNLVSQNRISVEEFGYDQPAGDGSNVSDCVLMVMDPWNQRSLRNFLRFKFVEGETVDTYINRCACYHTVIMERHSARVVFENLLSSAANYTRAALIRSVLAIRRGFFLALFRLLTCCAVF